MSISNFNSQETPKLSDEVLLAYLREHKPYLFDIEAAIIQINQDSGFGELVFNLRILNGLVEKGTASLTIDKFYVRRKNNQL